MSNVSTDAWLPFGMSQMAVVDNLLVSESADDDDSTSAGIKARIVSELETIKLSDEENATFNTALFPDRADYPKSMTEERRPGIGQFGVMASALCSYETRMQIYFAVLGELMLASPRISATMRMDQVANTNMTADLVASVIEMPILEFRRSTGEELTNHRDYARNLAAVMLEASQRPIIRREPEGYVIESIPAVGDVTRGSGFDIANRLSDKDKKARSNKRDFSYTPGQRASISEALLYGSNPEFEDNPGADVDRSSISPRFNEFYFAGFLSDFGQKVKEVTDKAHTILFGSPATKVNAKAAVKYHSLRGSDFAQLDTLLRSIPHVASALGDIEFFPRDMMPIQVTANMTCFKIAFRRTLMGRHAAQWLRSKSDPMFSKIPSSLYPYVAVTYHVGFSIHLSNNIVDYITQTTDRTNTASLLYRWFDRWASGYMIPANARGGNAGASRSTIPRTITSSADLARLRDIRKKLGFMDIESVGSPAHSGMAISGAGNIVYSPAVDDIDLDSVRKMERDLSSSLDSVFALGARVPSSSAPARETTIFSVGDVPPDDPKDTELGKLTASFDQLFKKYSYCVIGSDPMSGTVLTTGSDPFTIRPLEDDGLCATTSVEVADHLGYNLARDGETEAVRSRNAVFAPLIRNLFARTTAARDNLFRAGNHDEISDALYRISPFMSRNLQRNLQEMGNAAINNNGLHMVQVAFSLLSSAYDWAAQHKLVPSFDELDTEAQQLLSSTYRKYDMQYEVDGVGFDDAIYKKSSVLARYTVTHLQMYYCGMSAVGDATATRASSCLHNYLARQTGGQIGESDLENDWRYINTSSNAPLSQIGGIVGYMGGSKFVIACRKLCDVDKKALFNAMMTDSAMDAKQVLYDILPLAYLIGHAMPNAMKLFEEMEAHIESVQPLDSISPEDVASAGQHDYTLMAHQFDAQRYLHKPQPPKYGVLDIAPGGGKTMLGVLDIQHCADVLAAQGSVLRPAILAPGNLVGNWCADLHLSTHEWNIVPITSGTVRDWGYDRIDQIIHDAPPNTIFVISTKFVSNHHGKVDIELGGARIQMVAQLEFLRRAGFNYLLLDESHKAKGVASGSLVHRSIKRLFLQASVQFRRIATGTLTPDRVRDVVGQAALLTPGIFGTGDTLKDVARTNADGTINTDAIDEFNKVVTSMKSRLSRYAALVTYKRKHWAFMLPSPIESFLVIDIDDPNVPNSSLHRTVYDAFYNELVEALKVEGAANKAKRDATTDEGDESEDADTEAEEVYGDSDTEGDMGSQLRNNMRMSAYYQRMEQILTDPLGDPDAREIFANEGIKEFYSAKVRKIIERLRIHFEVQPESKLLFDNEGKQSEVSTAHQTFQWKPGVRPYEMDTAVYKGKRYLARKRKLGDPARYLLPESFTPPDQDIEYWKEESHGKVLILTWYDRCGDAIVEAIKKLYPEKAKNVIRLSSGANGIKATDAVELFRNDPMVEICVANEQAISEGHNMQVGSRIIRCDTPWSPGIVEQSHARIARPDFNSAIFDENGKPGDLKRSVIFIDWVMTNHTLEVAKVAKVAAKTVQTTIFAEEDNPRYDEIRRWANLEEVPYSIDILSLPEYCDAQTYQDPVDPRRQHFIAKATMSAIDEEEFAAMRETTASELVKIEGRPVPASRGFKIIDNVPLVPHQQVYDRWGYGLILFRTWYKQQSIKLKEAGSSWPESLKEYKAQFNSLPVFTEWGTGIIIGMTVSSDKFADKLLVERDVPFNMMRIQYPDGEIRSVAVTKVHVALNAMLPKSPVLKDFLPAGSGRKAAPSVRKTERDTRREERESRREEVADTREKEIGSSIKKAVRKEVDTATTATTEAKARRKNVAAGRNPNEGLTLSNPDTDTQVPSVKPIVPGDRPSQIKRRPTAAPATQQQADKKIKVIPTVYNGLLAFYVSSTDADYKSLIKDFGFKEFGSYVYCDSVYIEDYYKQLDMLEAKFSFDRGTTARLNDIQTVFEESGRQRFMYQIAYKRREELIEFFRVRHRDTQDKKMLKVYPSFLADRMRLMIDLKTNPQARVLIGKKTPGAMKYGTWEAHDGMAISFVGTLTAGKQLITKLQRAGYTITNSAALEKAMTKIRIRPEADKPKK